MKIADVPADVVELNIINEQFHARLLANIDEIAKVAGIPVPMVWARLSQYCTEQDMTWFTRMKVEKESGVVYVGVGSKAGSVPVEDRMMALAGAFLRNYIDARVMIVQDVVIRLKKDEMPSPTVLLIPNFCLAKYDGGGVAQWEVSSLLGLLYSRLAKGLKTVLYVSSMADLESQYGTPFVRHIETHYVIVKK